MKKLHDHDRDTFSGTELAIFQRDTWRSVWLGIGKMQ